MEDDSFLWCLLGGHVKMKLNISFLASSYWKLIKVDNEGQLFTFCEKYMVTEEAVDALGEEWKGSVF